MRIDKYQSHARYQQFIDRYAQAENPATASSVDPNANVERKNIATLETELFKEDAVALNRLAMYRKLSELYGVDMAEEYLRQLEEHEIYRHDETAVVGKPYCASVTLYPFLLHGNTSIGGTSDAPKNLAAFTGAFVNLVFALASQFCGAVSTPEWLSYMDYFVRKEYGDDYYLHADKTIDLSNRERSIDKVITDAFEQVVYSLNQPAAARVNQCVRADKTQLWTPNGFRYLHELHEGDLCYVWRNGQYSVEPIKHLNVYDYDGDQIQFYGNNYQQTVTPNHRVVYRSTDGSNGWIVRQAHEIEHHSKLSMPISGNLMCEDYPINDALLTLATFALTDGHLKGRNDSSRKRIIYCMSPHRKGLGEVIAALESLGIPYRRKKYLSRFGLIHEVTVSSVDAQPILNIIDGRRDRIPNSFLKLSQRQSLIVLNCWAKSDGQFLHGHPLRMQLQCDNMDIADRLQQIVLRAGLGTRITQKKCRQICGQGESTTTYVNTYARDTRRVNSRRIPYKGKIWCPTTDAGIVVFREDSLAPYISGNSVFWNIAYFDRPYFEGMFENFVFPDGTAMQWASVNWLQKRFMCWFNEERRRKLLTFPVETVNLLDDGQDYVDPEWKDFVAEMWAKGHSFFVYRSNSVDSLASCCRLRNELQDNTFSYTLGAGGVSTGSKCVISINVNRLVQDAVWDTSLRDIMDRMEIQIEKIHKYLIAFNEILKERLAAGLLPVYDAGYIALDKQYLTIGVNGLVEGTEALNIPIEADNPEYIAYVDAVLSPIYAANRAARTSELMFNTEMVPAEGLGVKNAAWEKASKLYVPRDCYNSYFFVVEDPTVNVLDKLRFHGKTFTRYLDGGSACHINLDEHLSKEQYLLLLNAAIRTGCNYLTFNVPNTLCNACGYISKHRLDACPKCGSRDLDYATRIIGYLKLISRFAHDRQIEANKRHYSHGLEEHHESEAES